MHRTGYVEVSHCFAGVIYDGRIFIDTAAALATALAAITVGVKMRAIAGAGDRLVLGLCIRGAGGAMFFAYSPKQPAPRSTPYSDIRIDQVADGPALENPLSLLRRFDERLGNAYGRDRTDVLLDDGGFNRMGEPLGGDRAPIF